jgi:hypothetical protein
MKMEPYKRFYFNWFILVIWILIITWMIFAYIYKWGNNPVDIGGLIIFLILFIGIFISVYGFYITIDNEKIEIKIGVGLIKKVIYFSIIKEVNLIENKFKYSLKKANLKDFRSYNFPTFERKAIEVKLKDNKTAIIIGIANTLELLSELKSRTNK